MNDTLNKERAFFNSLGNFYPADSSVDIAGESIDGVRCYWFTPQRYDENKIILYLHGGSFVLGSLQSHQPMVSHFASALFAKILFVEYALAPEQPFPNGVNDVLKVYGELTRQYPQANISIIGDSAGGGLCISFIHMAIRLKLPMPSSIIFISPFIYLRCNTASHESRKKMDPILTKDMLIKYANYYAADKGNEADPSQINFERFPPLFILVGSNEILFDDSTLFYEKIKPLQPDTKWQEYINQNHVWMLADIHSKESTNALRDIKNFINQSQVR